MDLPPPPRDSGRRAAPWGVLALVLLSGLALMRNGSGEFTGGPPQPAPAAAAGSPSPPPPGSSAAPALPPGSAPRSGLGFSRPGRVRIPEIGVDAPVRPVGLDAEGWVDAPPPGEPNLAGWFTGAVTPGERGAAVVVGHVDNEEGPAVFYGLGALRKGDRVEVDRADGRTVVFEVYGIEVFAKDRFPGERVYGPTEGPELRVITCGGSFHRGAGYDGNVVVFARRSAVR